MSVPSEPQIYIRPGVWDQNIQLYWQPPLDNGGGNILSYTLQCPNISFINILPSTDRSSRVSNLTNGVDHTFTIYATNEFGNSNVATYRTVQPGTEPDDPTNINCIMKVPGNLLLSWNHPVFTGNANLINSLITMTPIDFRGNLLTTSNVSFIKGLKPEFQSRIVLFPNTNYSYRALVQSINDSEYSSYENFSLPFHPLIPSEGLKLWLDPYDRSTITLSGTNIIRWNDKSFSRSNANISVSFAPIYDSANGLINFNGTQYLNLPANTLPSSNLPYSMFIYVSTSNIQINNQWFLYSGTPAGNSSLGGYFNSANIFHSWGNYQSLSNNTSTANTQVLLEYLYDGSTLRTYLDGSLILTNISNVKNSTSANNIIGSNSTITGNLRGSIGEILVYDRILSEVERLSIENYMINKKRMVSLFNLGNLLVWLDASDTNTLYDNQVRNKADANSNVFTWVNESESGVNILPANISLLPFNRPSQQNYLNTLEFNKSFLVSNSAGYPTDAYIIVQLANLSNVYDILGVGSTANANIYNSLSYGLVTANRFMNASNDTSRNFISTLDETSNGYVMLEWTIANSNTYIRRFGDELVYDNRLNWAAPNNLIYYIGEGNVIDTANALVGNIGEIIIFNKQLMYNERKQVEGYLAHKWGLGSSLSNVHPYKNTPPTYFTPFMREAPIRFSPNIYPNLLYWIDATDSGSYTLANGIISTIRDKSRSNLVTTITGYPIIKSSIINGYNTFGLNNSVNNFDSFNATLSNIIGFDNYAFATVWRQTSNANATVISMNNTNLSYANIGFLNIREGNVQSSTFATPFNNFYIQIGMRYGNTLVNYVNSNSSVLVSNLILSNISSNIIIGKTWSNLQPMSGDIAEAMVFRDLTQEQRITLEGYFARKYNLILPNLHPYFFNQLDIPFTPAFVNGLQVWLDASTLAFADNTTINTWSSVGGASQSFTGSMSVRTGILNGLNVVQFNTSQSMSNTGISLANYSFFMVTRQTGGSNGRVFQAGSTNSLWGYWSGYKTTFHSNGSWIYSPSIPSDTQWDIYRFTHDSNNYAGFFRYGTSILSSTTVNISGGIQQLHVNAGMYSGEKSDCQIAEVVIYNTKISDLDLQRVEGYLAWKWGLQNNLDIAHPYRNAPPYISGGGSYLNGFIVRVYNMGYYADNVNWFASRTPSYTFNGITNMTNIGTATNGNRPVDANDYYSVQWTGYFLCKVSGTHTFYTNSDDASYMWIGSTAISGFSTSNPLINNSGEHGMRTISATINLTAGIYYPIRMQFGENAGGDDMQVSFIEPGGSRTYNFSGYAFNQGTSNFT